MRLRLLACLALAALVTSCHDGTAPGPSITVSIALSGTPLQSVTQTDQELTLRCDVTLTATARGSGSATWQGGVMRFYYGATRQTLGDSILISEAEVRNAWGATIAPSEHPEAGWWFSASRPFDVELEFRYVGKDGGTVAPAKTRFTCGPPPAVGPPPTISQLVVTPDSDNVEVGGTIRVTYTAESPTALWATAVSLTGPFLAHKLIAENGVKSVTRTVDLLVPRGAQFGTPIGIHVIVEDASLQQTGQFVQTRTVVSDRTPPVISNVTFAGGSGAIGSDFTTFSRQFAVGDTLSLQATAFDNNSLGWLVWQLGAPTNFRDSVAVPAGVYSQTLTTSIPMRPEWVGSQTMSLYMRDGGGLMSAVVASLPNGLTVYPLVAHPTSPPAIMTASTAAELGDLVYDAKRNAIYLLLARTNEVAVLDVATMTFRDPMLFTAIVGGLDLSPSGDSLIVTIPSSRLLAVVNLALPADAPTTIAMPVLDTAGLSHSALRPQPMLVRVAANGMALVSLQPRTWSGESIVSVDLRTGTQQMRTDARNSGIQPIPAMGATPDRSRIVISDFNCSRSYLAATDAFTPCAADPAIVDFTHVITFDAAGQRFALGNGALDLSFSKLRAANGINGQVPQAVISPDGAYLYLGLSNTVSSMRIADGVLLERFNVPIAAQRMLVSPAGDWLMVFGKNGDLRAVRVDLQ